ncbi:MAG: hypothetical protein KAY37_04465 [Phycisphaerae bacterium]|nr:hypothetical protein [Phycisphaerae bacterium]
MAEEPQKKKQRKIGTLENLKTAMGCRLHSKPYVEGQEYIELYALKRDRARWLKGRDQAEGRLKMIDEAIGKIKLPEEQKWYAGDGGPR